VNQGRAAQLRESLTANLASFGRIAADQPGLTPASVAVCVMPTADCASLLITRRAPGLRAHAGQWALPGGRRDQGETVEEAALRELSEETGVRAAAADVVGLLDDYVTRSGYVITPVVVWANASRGELGGPASEVTRVYQVPLDDLDVDPKFAQIPESSRPVIRLPLFDRYVHAPTAAIIYQFCQVALHGNHVRVAHYDAPVFAWK
jgi:8-oxo-dGTP pyrophosphatase MutT (NUDIX family)